MTLLPGDHLVTRFGCRFGSCRLGGHLMQVVSVRPNCITLHDLSRDIPDLRMTPESVATSMRPRYAQDRAVDSTEDVGRALSAMGAWAIFVALVFSAIYLAVHLVSGVVSWL
jgi:hypothetical protein